MKATISRNYIVWLIWNICFKKNNNHWKNKIHQNEFKKLNIISLKYVLNGVKTQIFIKRNQKDWGLKINIDRYNDYTRSSNRLIAVSRSAST